MTIPVFSEKIQHLLSNITPVFASSLALLSIIKLKINKKERDHKKLVEATSGKLNFNKVEPLINHYDSFLVIIGSNGIGVNRKVLENGWEYRLQNLHHRIDEPNLDHLILKLKDNKILITATVTSFEGKNVAKIVDNEWTFGKNLNCFEFNHDSNGIEIVDDYGVVVLQLFSSNNRIEINGVFDSGNMKLVSTPKGVYPFYLQQGTTAYRQIGATIPHKFKYPSKDYIGVRI